MYSISYRGETIGLTSHICGRVQFKIPANSNRLLINWARIAVVLPDVAAAHVPFSGADGRNDAALTVTLGDFQFTLNQCTLVKRTGRHCATGPTYLLVFDINRSSTVEFGHWTRPDLPAPPDPHLRQLVAHTVSYDGVDSTAIEVVSDEDNAGVVTISVIKHFARHPLLNMVLGQLVMQPITFHPQGTTLYPDDAGYAMDVHGQISVTDGLFLKLGAHMWIIGSPQEDLRLIEEAVLPSTFAEAREPYDPNLIADDNRIARTGQPLEAMLLFGQRPYHDARFGV